jgi:hypothetical protein
MPIGNEGDSPRGMLRDRLVREIREVQEMIDPAIMKNLIT